ncbi:MAG: glycosyltransferase [Planctomycetota bacterium]
MPGRDPLVTLALPTWNGEAHLEAALASCLAQRAALPRADDLEVLLVDDGSVDDTLAIARRFAAQGLVVHSNPRPLGIAGNWNRCLDLARGEFVGLLHQDDRLRAGYLARALALFQREPGLGLLHSPYEVIDGAGQLVPDRHEELPPEQRERALPGREIMARLFRGRSTAIVCPGVLARRTVWRAVGGFDTRWRFALDLDMWMRVSEQYDVGCLGEPLVEYRRHEDQQTSRESSAARAREMIAVKRVALSRWEGSNLLAPAVLRSLRGSLAAECVRFARRHAAEEPVAAWEHLRCAAQLRPSALLSLAAAKGAARAALSRRPRRAAALPAGCALCGAREAETVLPEGASRAEGPILSCSRCGLLFTDTPPSARLEPALSEQSLESLTAEDRERVAALLAESASPPAASPPAAPPPTAPKRVLALRGQLEERSDAVAFLRRAAARLSPEGALLVIVPDATLYSAGSDLAGARRLHFTPGTLRELLARAGLRAGAVQRHGLRGLARTLHTLATPRAADVSTTRSAAGAAGGAPPSEAELTAQTALEAVDHTAARERIRMLAEGLPSAAAPRVAPP